MNDVKALLFVLLFAASALAQGTKSQPAKLPSEKIDPQALLNDILGHAPKSNREMMGILKIREPGKDLREVPIKWLIRPLQDQWHDVYQTPEKSTIPAETLIVVHREGATNHYEYVRAGAKIPEAATNPFVPFATSDFWLADFGLEFLHWPNPKHVKTEMRKSRPCYVIETRPPNPTKDIYARVLSWIDTEQGGLIRAEAYDQDGKLWKEFQIGRIGKVQGRWQIKSIGIRNEKTDTNTRLEFTFELDE